MRVFLASGGLARRVYLATTLLITVGTVLFGWAYTEQRRQLYTEREVARLTEIAARIEQRLGSAAFPRAVEQALAADPEVADRGLFLYKLYQPVLEEVVAGYPGVSAGIYCRELHRVVAIVPDIGIDRLDPQRFAPDIWRIYDTGRVEVAYIRAVAWGGKPALAVQYPIYHSGRLIGHTWANVRLSDFEQGVGSTVVNVLLVVAAVWLAGMAIVSFAFGRLVGASRRLAAQIYREDDAPAAIGDFPELRPVLDTVRAWQEKCRGEADKLRRLIEVCPISITVFDKEGRVEAVSRESRDKYPEQAQGELIGMPLRRMAELRGYPYEETPAYQALRGRTVVNQRMTFGGREWLAGAVPLRAAPEGEVEGAVVVMQDITEYEQLKAEVNKLDRARLVSAMAAGVAHEIRNPLTVIKGYLQLFRQKAGEGGREQYQLVLDELDRVEAIISDFLSLAQNKATEKRRQSLNEIVRQVYPLLYADAVSRGVEIRLRLDDSLPDLDLDDKEIKQLILNLARNSIEAIDGGGYVWLVTERRGGAGCLAIADDGCGIPGDQLGKIFDPFYTTKEGGTGLGLAVSASIAHRHGARIIVESQPGLGTTIAICFPRGVEADGGK